MHLTPKQMALRNKFWLAIQSEIGLYTISISIETYLSDLDDYQKYLGKKANDPYLGRYFASAFDVMAQDGDFDKFDQQVLQKLENGHSPIRIFGQILHHNQLLMEAALELELLIMNDPSVWQISIYLVKLFGGVDLNTDMACFIHYHTRLNALLQTAFNSEEIIQIESIRENAYEDKFPDNISSPKNVIFLSKSPLIRLTKLRDAVQRAGITVALLAPSEVEFQEEYLSGFDTVNRYNNLSDIWRYLENTDAQAVHSFTTTDAGTLDALAAYVCVPSRFVYDVYDVPGPEISAISRVTFDDKLTTQMNANMALHRVIIDQGSNICTRSIYPKFLKTPLSNVRQARIFIPEPCIKDYTAAPKLSEVDGKLHIVHGGSFLTEKSGDSPWSSLLWLAERAEKLDVHFHLYAMPWVGQDMSEYESISEHSANFHNHGYLPYDQWMSEISKYDIGMFYVHPADEKHLAKTPRAIDPSGAWSNKISDYIDAGLYTVISNKYRLMAWYVGRYGVGQGVALDQVLEKSFWDDLRQKVFSSRDNFKNARKPLNQDAIGERLAKFYQSL